MSIEVFRNSKILKILSIVLLVSVLVGCTQGGDTGGGDTGGGDTGGGTAVRLQWWGVFWDTDVVNSLIERYQSENPNVEILYRNMWEGGESSFAEKSYQNALESALTSPSPEEDLPDIFMVHNTWAGNYIPRFVSSAPSYVVSESYVEDFFYPAVLEDFSTGVDGSRAIWGLPLWMDTLAVVYNSDLLEAAAYEINVDEDVPPRDWVDFRDMALDITQYEGNELLISGFAAGTGGNIDFAMELMSVLFLQNGVEMVNPLTNIPEFDDNPDAESAVDFYESFAGSGGTWNSKQKTDAAEFLDGDVAMMVATSWRLHDMLDWNAKYDLGLDIGVAPLPQLSTLETINFATYWANMVALNRPNRDEAWKFVKWLSEPEQLRELRVNESTHRGHFQFIYPRTDMAGEMTGEVGHKYLRYYIAALPYAHTWPMVDGVAVRDAFVAFLSGNANLSTLQKDVAKILSNKNNL